MELWYVDQNEMTKSTFTREQGLRFYRNFDTRARKMTDAVDFPARPNKFVCGRCSYKTVCDHSAADAQGAPRKKSAPHPAAGDFKPWE